MNRNARRRVVWLIVDGVTHWIVERMWGEDRLPHLRALASAGAFRATCPVGPNCETPVQLATLFTGHASRDHGVLGYHMALDDDPFRTRSGFVPAGLACAPVWRDALDRGDTVALTHVAFAEAARDGAHENCALFVEGYGRARGNTFVAPAAEKAPWIERVGRFRGNGRIGGYLRGRFGARFTDGRAESDYLATLFACADYFAAGALDTIDRFPADFTMLYFPCTDEIAHAVMHDATDESAPDRQRAAWQMLADVYDRADRLVGDLRERLDGNGELIVCSDHGVAPIDRRLHPNRVLVERGFCTVGSRGSLDRKRSRVFYSPANNGLLRRSPTATDDDVEAALAELTAWRDPATDEPVIDRVLRPGDDFAEDRGCAFLVATPGYELSATDSPTPITASTMRGHHQSGAWRPALRGVLFAPEIPHAPDDVVPNTAVRAIVDATLERCR